MPEGLKKGDPGDTTTEDGPPSSHADAYLEGAANSCKGAPDSSLSHLRVNLEIITVSLRTRYGDPRGHPSGSLQSTRIH